MNSSTNAVSSLILSALDHLSSPRSTVCIEEPQTLLYHLANAFLLVSFASLNSRYGQVVLHMGLIVGYLFLSTWAWNVICAPTVFAWYFSFMLLNMGQLLYILYRLRPIKFDEDLDQVYKDLFEPMRITRIQFKRFVNADSAQIVSLHSGECYAIENMTKTDRLGLLLTGKANVLNEKTFLHHIHPQEFLDSPEFESSNSEETFKVSICAAVPSKYIMWQRASLEYLFVKEPYLAQVVSAVISRDLTEKLFVMNDSLKTSRGDNIDLRLPGIAARLSQMENREHAIFRTNNNNAR